MNEHTPPQSPAPPPPPESRAGTGADPAAVAPTTGNSASLDDVVDQLLQLATQDPLAELPRSDDQSWGTLWQLFHVNGAILLVALVIGVIGVNILHQNPRTAGDPTVSGTHFYSTSDAAVSGTLVTISPPLPGTVDAVFTHVGSRVHAGDLVATVKTIPGAIMHIKSPVAGTIVNEGATLAEVLGAGTPLAQVVDLDNLFITAYVEERRIADIHPNESADITVASVPGVTYHGRVIRIGPVTRGAFTLSPSADNADGTFAQASRRIPVQVSLSGYRGKQIYPGGTANVTVFIR